MSHQVLRLPDVIKRTGLSSATIYRHIAAGSFPERIRLGERSVGWLESDIEQWLDDKVSDRRSHQKT